MPDLHRLSRTVSHALRHEPWRYELELDDEGWTPVDQLLHAVRQADPALSAASAEDLKRMIETADKRRHELSGDRIRALYGHSLPGRLAKERATPPEILFHGTSPDGWKAIEVGGLKPMSRQYVHLSVDRETAGLVGGRKSPSPVILVIDARSAHDSGIPFLIGNDAVWLAENVPAEFVRRR